jgi:Stage II sporulation protein R (spore_II_R).
LRFHVRANSDSVSDQILKYQVRDEVAACLQEELIQADSLSESRQIVAASLEEIENTAQGVLDAKGSDYSVKASIGEEWFPQKNYGRFCFPQGKYEALVLEIGSGKGRNWWCVMYPNMCFSGSVYEVDETGKELKEVLDEEEYRQVIKNKDYKVSFKGLNNLVKKVKIRR